MDGQENVSVESINTQIAELRETSPTEQFRSGTVEQKQHTEKLTALYKQKQEITSEATANANAVSESNSSLTGNLSLKEIDQRIGEIRNNPAYNDKLKGGAEKRELHNELNELYQQRQEVDDGKGNRADRTFLKPENVGNLTAQARAELKHLESLGMDISNEDIGNITQAEVDGYKRVRQIEQGDFKGLSGHMTKSAKDAGYSMPEVLALKGFLATKFSGTNDLKKKILRVISEDIYFSMGA